MVWKCFSHAWGFSRDIRSIREFEKGKCVRRGKGHTNLVEHEHEHEPIRLSSASHPRTSSLTSPLQHPAGSCVSSTSKGQSTTLCGMRM